MCPKNITEQVNSQDTRIVHATDAHKPIQPFAYGAQSVKRNYLANKLDYVVSFVADATNMFLCVTDDTNLVHDQFFFATLFIFCLAFRRILLYFPTLPRT